MIWFTLILFVVSFLLTALLAPKPEFENARPSQLDDVNFPRATEDAPIPLILGKARMNGPNTIWYGDFTTVPIIERVKTGLFSKKNVVMGHNYFMGVDLALGMGPGLTMSEIYMDDKLIWSGSTSATVPTAISIDEPTFFGGYKNGGGWVGNAVYYPGALNLTGNPVNTYIEGIVGAGGVPAYIGTAHIVFEANNIGESAQLRKVSFVMENYTNDLTGIPDLGKVGDDMNPAEAIYQIMTDPWRGMGVAIADIDLVALRVIGTTLHTEGNGVSIVITAETDGAKLIQEIMRQIDGIAHQDPETGQITFKLIRDDYDVGLLDTYDEDDIIKVTNFARTGWDDVVAQVKISFPQRDAESTAVAISQDMATITMLGRMKSTTLSMPFCYDKDTANKIASRERAQLSIPLFRMTLEMNRNANQLRPGSVFKVDWPEYGLVGLVMRVQEFDFGSLLDGRLVAKCLQDSFAVSTVVFAAPPDTAWVAPVYQPSDISHFGSVELPSSIQQRMDFPPVDGFAAFAFFPLPAFDGRSTQFTALTGTTVGDVTLADPSEIPYGPSALIDVNYAKEEGHDTGLDSTVGIVLDRLFFWDMTVFPGTLPDLKTGEIGTIYMNGEWMGYLSIVDNLDGTFTLTDVYRGLYGTNPVDHLATDVVAELDWSLVPEGYLADLSDTGTIYYKLLDSAGPVSQTPEQANQQTDTAVGVADRPVRPRLVKINGSRASVAIAGTVDASLTWLASNRNATYLTVEDDAVETPAETELYDIEVWLGGIEIAALGSTGETTPYTIPFGANPQGAETDAEVRVYATRTGGDLRTSLGYGFISFEVTAPPPADTLLLSGDAQSGTDALLTSGDAQSGTDIIELSGDMA